MVTEPMIDELLSNVKDALLGDQQDGAISTDMASVFPTDAELTADNFDWDMAEFAEHILARRAKGTEG